MIFFDKFELENGLKVIFHQDKTTPMAVLNLLYNVGSKDESEHKTGFAHLFEHLMFGGSINIPSFDEPLQKVGGENNAFTSPDITNYYITVPAENIETAFWLESDRMLSLSFDPQVLEVQRKVVIEEFKQRYLNQPYGDVWLKIRPLAYKTHSYRWATIGKNIEHIENATMDDVKSFFKKFYIPNNAVLVIAGNLELEKVKELCMKWFAPIPAGEKYVRNLPQEPQQVEARFEYSQNNVPLKSIYKAYHAPGKLDKDFYASDLLSDVLGRGQSSLLHSKLVKEQKLFNSVNAYLSSSIEPGLLIIEGKLHEHVSFNEAEKGIESVIDEILKEKTSENQLNKVKNQALSTLIFGETELLNRAMALAFAENLGDAALVNSESSKIEAVTLENFNSVAKKILRKENCSTLHYDIKNEN
ncbi:MAG: pitrilysin family protein [Cytophagales bacterium]